jgi:Leucine-rich repeat (LRR) protein
LSGLISYSASRNQFTELPPEFGTSFPYLRHLDLSQNKLQSLPGSLAELKHLRQLNLSRNRLADFDITLLDSWPHLMWFSATYNKLPADQKRLIRASNRYDV